MAQSLSFPSEFPYEHDSLASHSGLNSPVDSAVSSTDGSSVDDDFFLGLAQQLAWTSLRESHKSLSPCFNPNIENIRTGSPQSTLSGFDSWFRPECSSSLLKSSSLAVLEADNDARLKMSSEMNSYQSRDHLVRGFLGVRSSIPVKTTNDSDYELFSNQNCARNLEFPAQKFREDLVLQILCASSWRRQAPPNRKPEIHNRERHISHVTTRCGGGTGGVSHSPWLQPPRNQQQPPNSSNVRCVHPGRSSVKRTSGTGVFLPRRHVNPSDCRQKRGIPANPFAEGIINTNEAPLNHYQSPGFDSISTRRTNPLTPIPRNFRAEVAINQELLLPQEWTY